MSDKEKPAHLHLLYCSFCGKSQMEVRKLLAGPTVFICNECVDLCAEIVEEKMLEKGYVRVRTDSPDDNPDVREVILLTGTVDSTTTVTGIVND